MNALLLAGWLVAAPVASAAPAASETFVAPETSANTARESVTGPAVPDTTVTLRRGDRVAVENLSGHIVVRGGDRSTLSLRGRDDRLQTVVIAPESVHEHESRRRRR